MFNTCDTPKTHIAYFLIILITGNKRSTKTSAKFLRKREEIGEFSHVEEDDAHKTFILKKMRP